MRSHQQTATRITVGLAVAGAVAGSIAGGLLTALGKLVADAPPATAANYAWNMAAFALIGAVLTPTVIWSALRRAPLWRTVVEPLVAGIAGAGLGMLAGSGLAFLALPVVGITAAVLRLNYTHRKADDEPKRLRR